MSETNKHNLTLMVAIAAVLVTIVTVFFTMTRQSDLDSLAAQRALDAMRIERNESDIKLLMARQEAIQLSLYEIRINLKQLMKAQGVEYQAIKEGEQ